MSYTSDAEGELLREVYLAKGGSQPVLDSVNYFYRKRIPELLSAFNLTTNDGNIATFTNPRICRPTIHDLKSGGRHRELWPYEARRNNLSYMAQLFATLQLNQNVNGRLVPIPGQSVDVFLGKIPAILHSEICRLYGLSPEERYAKGEPEKDPGAYAIIKGMEKVLLNIENLRTSEAFLYEDKEKFTVRYTSQSLIDTTVNIIKEEQDIHVTFSKMGISNNSINVFFIFYVLGFTNKTVETVLQMMDDFIIDKDPERQARRRQEMRNYMQLTVNTFLQNTGGNQEIIYNKLSGKIHDKNILDSANRNTLIMDMIWRELFKNIPLNYRDISERTEAHVPGLLSILVTKARMLASMIVKYVEFRNGYRDPDDRDRWGSKQLVDAGRHLGKAFARIWRLMINNIQSKITTNKLTTAEQIKRNISRNYMAEQFINAYNKELFISSKGQREIAIVDSLKRDNILSAISHIRRISTPTNRRAKIREKRLIHNTQWGVACPIMSPEGESCGLVKDAAITTYVSLDRDESVVRSRLEGRQLLVGATIVNTNQGQVIQTSDGIQYPMSPSVVQTNEGVIIQSEAMYSVNPTPERRNSLWLNGVHLGFCDSEILRKQLDHMRLTGQLFFDSGIILDQYGELRIFTNEGRICRPLLLVDETTQDLVIDIKGLRGQSLEILMMEGAIGYIDVAEQEQVHMLIAEDYRHIRIRREELIITSEQYERLSNDPTSDPKQIEDALNALKTHQNRMKYTHCEIDPTAILGISAISMPFPEFNPGPRDTYQASMVRQALGGNSSRNELRFDTTMKTILEPGVPTVSTDAHEFLGLDEYPSGRELVIAITTYGGSNQEDALTFNKAAIDLGLFLMMIYHSYKTTVCQSTKHKEIIRKPDHPRSQDELYSKLDPETNIVRVGEYVKSGDCLVAKVIVGTDGQVKDDSLYVDIGKEGIVDEVYVTENAEECKLIRIRLRELRKLQTGDKLASRYSQKGTIGEIVPEKDMPWIVSENKHLNGVKPHLIFNPHGIPSRMTIGKLYEIIVGKSTSVTGERFNATAFRRFGQPNKPGEAQHDNIFTVKEQLELMGFSRSGKERMVSGITGREIDVEIYTGTVYYQLLRHLVKDKMQARATGTVQFLTRQPTSGIRKEGGLRLGEMERDALLEYGASYLQQERMIISSDAYQAIVCKECGMFAATNMELGVQKCRKCHTGTFTRVTIPYAFKLLTHYLAAANMRVRLRTKEI